MLAVHVHGAGLELDLLAGTGPLLPGLVEVVGFLLRDLDVDTAEGIDQSREGVITDERIVVDGDLVVFFDDVDDHLRAAVVVSGVHLGKGRRAVIGLHVRVAVPVEGDERHGLREAIHRQDHHGVRQFRVGVDADEQDVLDVL